MNTDTHLKKDILISLGFALLLLALTYPLSFLAIELLNFVLGRVPL